MSSNWILAMRPARKRFFACLEAVLFTLVLALLVLVILQVFTRYVMQTGIPWTEEVARMVLVWMVMIGAAISAERNEQYAITFLSQRLKGGVRHFTLIGTNVLGLIFLVALTVHGTDYVLANMKTVYVSTQTSKAFVYLALPAGAAVMGISLLLHSIEAFVLGEPDRVDPVIGAVKGDV